MHNEITNIIEPEKAITNDKDTANTCNKYFCNIANT